MFPFIRLLVAVVIAGTAGALVLQQFGPFKGWLDRMTAPEPTETASREEPSQQPDSPEAAEEANKNENSQAAPSTTPSSWSSASDTEKSEDKKESSFGEAETESTGDESPSLSVTEKKRKAFKKLRKEFLSKLDPLTKGEKLSVELIGGSERKLEGEFVKRTNKGIKLRVKHGIMVLPFSRIDLRSTPRLFPERAASYAAMRKVREMDFSSAESDKQTTETASAKGAWDATPESTGQGADSEEQHSIRGRYAEAYDIRPGTTPDDINPTLQQLANWMEIQQRRMGGKLVERMYGGKTNGRVCACLVANERFLKQTKDWRVQVAQGIWHYWAIRADASGVVNRPANAHLVLLSPDYRIVGGSTPEDASDIWSTSLDEKEKRKARSP